MNKAILIGRLTRDPELRTTPTGRNVCQFSVAVSRNFTNANGEREADFINCVVWDKQAENLVKYQRKVTKLQLKEEFKQEIMMIKMVKRFMLLKYLPLILVS